MGFTRKKQIHIPSSMWNFQLTSLVITGGIISGSEMYFWASKNVFDLPRTKNWGMPPPSGYSKISSLLRYWKESDLKMYILQIERFLEKDSYGKISIFNCVVFLSKNNFKKKPPTKVWMGPGKCLGWILGGQACGVQKFAVLIKPSNEFCSFAASS